MIATSLNMSTNNFLNDKYIFENDNNFNALIQNNGELNSYEGGIIALIANRVENNGSINTPSGSSALLSGDKVELSLDGNQLISYSIEKGSLNSLIENNHAINATDGAVILSSKEKMRFYQLLSITREQLKLKELQNKEEKYSYPQKRVK